MASAPSIDCAFAARQASIAPPEEAPSYRLESSAGLPASLLEAPRERVRCSYCWAPRSFSAAIGVSVPNNPLVSLFGPAVKNSVVAGPALPLLPNRSAHNPSISKVLPSGFSRFPRKWPVTGLKAEMLSPRKLPIRIVLVNTPKPGVAHTTPQGALNHGPCSIRCNSRPCRSNTSTKPSPGSPG